MPILMVVLQHWKVVLLGLLLVFIFALLAALNAKNGKIAKLQAEHAQYIEQSELALLKANIVSKTIAEKYQAKLAEANQDAIIRIKQAQAAADRARDAVDSLRESTSRAASKLTNSEATCSTEAEYGIAASDVLNHCAAEYRSLAEIADGHANDVRTLIAAWPE